MAYLICNHSNDTLMKENLARTGSFGKSKDEHMKRELHSSGFLFRESWQFRTDV